MENHKAQMERRFDTEDDAYAFALLLARESKSPYYMVKWQLGFWTVSGYKPSLAQCCLVIDEDGSKHLA